MLKNNKVIISVELFIYKIFNLLFFDMGVLGFDSIELFYENKNLFETVRQWIMTLSCIRMLYASIKQSKELYEKNGTEDFSFRNVYINGLKYLMILSAMYFYKSLDMLFLIMWFQNANTIIITLELY